MAVKVFPQPVCPSQIVDRTLCLVQDCNFEMSLGITSSTFCVWKIHAAFLRMGMVVSNMFSGIRKNQQIFWSIVLLVAVDRSLLHLKVFSVRMIRYRAILGLCPRFPALCPGAFTTSSFWCLDHIPNLADYLPERYFVNCAPAFQNARAKCIQYLRRKYDMTFAYTEKMVRIEYPSTPRTMPPSNSRSRTVKPLPG